MQQVLVLQTQDSVSLLQVLYLSQEEGHKFFHGCYVIWTKFEWLLHLGLVVRVFALVFAVSELNNGVHRAQTYLVSEFTDQLLVFSDLALDIVLALKSLSSLVGLSNVILEDFESLDGAEVKDFFVFDIES